MDVTHMFSYNSKYTHPNNYLPVFIKKLVAFYKYRKTINILYVGILQGYF